MKKIFLTLVVLAIAFCAFATDKIEYPGTTDFAFRPTSTRLEAMGGAGIAAPGRMDAFYLNPAALGEKRFTMSLPGVTVTLYNVHQFLSNQANVDSVNRIIDGGDPSDEMAGIGAAILKNLGKGNNEILTADAVVGFKLGPVGLGVAVQEKLHAVNESGQTSAQFVIPEVNAAATLGLGFKVIDTDSVTLSLGASAHYVIKAYLKAQDATSILNVALADDPDFTQYLTGTPAMVGTAIPIDAGATLGFFDNSFRIAASVNNINGKYNMIAYPGFATYLKHDLGLDIDIEGTKPKDAEETKFAINVPMTINGGIAWAPNWKGFQPVITADLVDIQSLIKEEGKFMDKALLHLNAGAEINLLSMVAVRAGLNRGYMSVGASLGVFGIRVDASYYWREYGLQLGDKKVDALSIKINIGSDKY